LYEEGIFEPETQSFVSIPHTTKIGVVVARNPIVAKPSVYCINCHHINHNVETCQIKKEEEPIIIVTKINAQVVKLPKPLTYLWQICGIVGHKLTNYHKFGEVQTIFKDKGKQIKVKFVTTLINMVDVHMATTNSKATSSNYQTHEENKIVFMDLRVLIILGINKTKIHINTYSYIS
jgi:hypothetical protein